jgi:hypothetical protein
LNSVPGPFAAHVLAREPMQLLVDHRHDLLQRPLIALIPGFQQRCDLMGLG